MEQSTQGRFLRPITIAMLIGGLSAGIGGTAFAHGGGHGHHGRGMMSAPLDPARMDARIERRVERLARKVEATPEQRTRLIEIAKSAASDLRPLREKVREARKRGMALLAAPTVDRAAIEKLRAEQIAAADAASRRMSQALADSAEVLTPEQRQKVAQYFERRKDGRRGEHRQRG
jgi:periplasmic protein CpxP/Spy